MNKPPAILHRNSSTKKPPQNALRALASTLERRASTLGNSHPSSATNSPNVGICDNEDVGDQEKRALTALLGVQAQQEELVREMRQEMLDVEKKVRLPAPSCFLILLKSLEVSRQDGPTVRAPRRARLRYGDTPRHGTRRRPLRQRQ